MTEGREIARLTYEAITITLLRLARELEKGALEPPTTALIDALRRLADQTKDEAEHHS